MDTPVLSQNQLKKTLSAKKKLKKATVKNILATPYSSYWPLVNNNDAVSLSDVLRQGLVRVTNKINVPWNQLKNVPREQRKEERLNYRKTNVDVEDVFQKANIAFGVNDTSRLLENNKAVSILITAEVNPQVMVKHIIDMAVLKKVAILIVPNLKSILKEKTGIASTVVAFKELSEDSVYWVIHQKILEVATNHPVPEDHLYVCNNNNEDLRESCSTMDEDEVSVGNEAICKMYLYRKSKTERVFVPEPSRMHDSSLVNKISDNEFLAFTDSLSNSNLNNESKSANVPVKKSKLSYKSLIIKRITNNKDRDKKKIQMLKKR